MTRVGQRDKRVTVTKLQRVSDGAGGGSEAWAPVTPVLWARIRPIGTRQYLQAAQERASITAEITIQARKGLAEGMRVLGKDGQRYTIKALQPSEDRRELVLLCETLGPGDP